MACNECGGYRTSPPARRGFSISPRRPRMASKGLRVASEGSSMGPWERTVQTDQE